MSSRRLHFKDRCRSRAFTLLELMTTITICGLVAGIAFPAYRSVAERQRLQVVVNDLTLIAMKVQGSYAKDFRYPESLEAVGLGDMRDPWGNPYRYLAFDSGIPGIKGKIRKDHNLHPINSDFDLYGMGPDGDSKSPLTAKASRDDILWARDGAFIGPASEF